MSKSMIVTKCMTRLRDSSTTPSFRMIPISSECPFLMCEFDPSNSHLVVLSKERKEELQPVPTITETGEYKKNKNGAQMVERRLIPEYFEIHVTDVQGIQDFVEAMAINADKQELYIPYIAQIEPIKAGMEKQPLILGV